MSDDEVTAGESTPLWNRPGSYDYKDKKILLGHKIARFLSRYGWYNPSKNNTDPIPPSLASAWAYFEHNSLPRRYVKEDPDVYNRAPVGEKDEPTELYPLWKTPFWEMGDFGVGVGMYFITLQYFIVVTFVAGLISLPNYFYFKSDDYGNSGGTAECRNVHWRPCPTCTEDAFYSRDRFATGISTVDGSQLSFIKVNECVLSPYSGYVSLVVLIFVIVAVWYYMSLQRKIRGELDEGEITCADYSLEIVNPPKDCEHSRDPKKWKEFFEEAFPDIRVVVCTVALDNYELQSALVARRKILSKLEPLFGDDAEEMMTNRGALAERMEKWSDSPEFYGRYKKIVELDVKIDELCQQDYDASRVFVTFEKEEMQRTVLGTMIVPRARPGLLDEKYKFHGHVLVMVEADEPSSIRWNDYEKPILIKMFELSLSFSLSSIVTVIAGYLIYVARSKSTLMSTIAIILLNVFTPQIAKFITSFESHGTQTSVSASVYIKVAIIRWVNTALVYFLITPFADTLGKKGLVPDILALLKGEIMIRAPLQLSDWRQQIFRHYYGPRAKDQQAMNLNFQGGAGEIATRYTEVTKILFLAFFAQELIPGVFFYASLILTSYLVLDKFCFLRTWRQGPRVGAEPSLYSVYFYLVGIIVYAFMAFYFYAQFPFDNAEVTSDAVPDSYLGSVTATDLNGERFDLEVTSEDTVYKFIDLFLWRNFLKTFKLFPKVEEGAWIEEAQKYYSSMYKWIFIVIFLLMVITIVGRFLMKVVHLCLVKSFDPVGLAADKKYGEVPGINGYVPQIKIPGVQYPMILCDVDEVPQDLIGWNDATADLDRSFDKHNLLLHVPEFKEFTFSIVKYWE